LLLKGGVVVATVFHSGDFALTADTGIGVDLTLATDFHCIYFQIAVLDELWSKLAIQNDFH
jgi:hypothetical protein